jgi:hypothetical protein
MRRRVALLLMGLGAVAMTAGCAVQRVEYRNRPAYYKRMVDGPLPDREVLPDGTIVIYGTRDKHGVFTEAADDGDTPFNPREEMDDGSVRLYAFLPEHVVANTLECLRNEEYELLWDQMIAERTKLVYAERGQGLEEFSDFFAEHRVELAKMLNRMSFGLTANEIVVESVGQNVTRCRFAPDIAQQFKFKNVLMVNEGFGMKLMLIQ